MKDTIAYTCYRDGFVLAKQQLSNSQYAPGQIIFPGGRVDQKDASVTAAFYRELREELGIEAAVFCKGNVLSIPQLDMDLYPFLLLSWNGNIPDITLDKEDRLVWRPLELIQRSHRSEVAALATIFNALAHP
jgi:8-oxo-dGTP pyrophosphatase MutT (NUDIX family)